MMVAMVMVAVAVAVAASAAYNLLARAIFPLPGHAICHLYLAFARRFGARFHRSNLHSDKLTATIETLPRPALR
jgi:hypothetical protein